MLTIHPIDDVRVRHRELATLHREGFAVQLYGAVPRLEGSDEISDLVEAVGDPMNGLRDRARHHFQLFRRLITDRPSIVHLHEPETLWMAPVAKALGARVIYDVHEYHEMLYSRRVPEQLTGVFERFFVAAERSVAGLLTDCVVTVTPQLIRRFENAGRVLGVENFAERSISRDRPQPEEEWLDRNGVISIGSLGVARGTELLLDAYQKIAQQAPDLSLFLIGRYSRHYTEAMLSDALKARGLSEVVTVLPNSKPAELAKLLGVCRVGLSVTLPGPDADGAYPTKLFEYMAQQLAVVSTEARNSVDIIAAADAGLAVPCDASAIAEAVCALHGDGPQSYRYATSGYEGFRSEFSWESGPAERLVSVYRSLGEGRGA